MTKVIFALHFYLSACPSSLPAGDVSSSSQRDSTGLLGTACSGPFAFRRQKDKDRGAPRDNTFFLIKETIMPSTPASKSTPSKVAMSPIASEVSFSRH